MLSNSDKNRILSILSLIYGKEVEDIIPDANFRDDLVGDSLDNVELIMQLEDEFEMEISDEDAARIKTVGDIFDYIAEKTTEQNS